MKGTFLDALTDDEVAELHAAGRRRTYGPGVTLVHEGDDAGPVVVLLRGRVKIAGTGGGREAIVAVRGPGDLIGELSAIDGGPRSATVTTLESTEVLLVAGSAFAALLERRPRIALVILRMVAARLRYSDSQQAQFATHDVLGRVSRRLVELADRFGQTEDECVQIELPRALAGGARGVDGRVAGGGQQGAPDAASRCGSWRRGESTSRCSTRPPCAAGHSRAKGPRLTPDALCARLH